MIRKTLTASVATAAMVLAGAALAAPPAGGGAPGGGPSAAAATARMNSQGPANASPTGIAHASPNSVLNSTTTPAPTTRAVNSQALQHANTRAIGRANPNSVLARSSVPGTSLPGLTQGLNVVNANGTALGTVSRIVTDNSGNVRLVIVTSPTGQTYRLAPNSLSINGTTVTTTSPIGG